MAPMLCAFCNNEMPALPGPQCPHCERPAATYPNVHKANDIAHTAELKRRRSRELANAEAHGCKAVFEDFESAVGRNAQAVLAMSWAAAEMMLTSDNVLYNTYYQQVAGEARLPRYDEISRARSHSEGALYPGYKEKIRHLALSLDGLGISNYAKGAGPFGDFEAHCELREELIAHRATVFESNNVMLAMKEDPAISGLPSFSFGKLAAWTERGTMAVVKHGQDLDSTTQSDQYPGILMRQGADKTQDEFIEVHIFGRISRRAMTRVKLKAPKKLLKYLAVRMRAFKEQLAQIGIELDLEDVA